MISCSHQIANDEVQPNLNEVQEQSEESSLRLDDAGLHKIQALSDISDSSNSLSSHSLNSSLKPAPAVEPKQQ